MKIAFVINSLRHRRGAEVFLSNLVCEISQNNECIVVCLYDGIDKSFIRAFENNGIKVYFCNKRNRFDLKSAKKFRKIINDFNPKIINTHLSILITYFFAFGFKNKKWHIVHTIHSVPNKEANFITNLLRRFYIKLKLLSFIGISENITSLFLQKFKKADILTVNNGIAISSQPLVEENKSITFLCVASFTAVKNHKLLLDFFKIVNKTDKKANLVCIGEGPLFKEIVAYKNELSLEDCVKFFEPTDNISVFLKKSKYVVLSSTYEGNPLSVLEGLACGVPAIVPNIGGLPDIIQNGINGILYNVGELDSFYDAYVKIKENDYNQMRLACFNSVKDYSIQNCAKSYLDFFKDCANRK